MLSFSWGLVLVAVLVVILKTNVRWRLILFNCLTYLSLTGWYYYRRWTTAKPNSPTKQRSSSIESSNRQSNNFECTNSIKSAPVVRNMSNSSGNSSGDEKQSAPKSHLGIFRNLSSQSISKSNKADQQKSSSMSTHSASSSLHIPSGPRATLSGKKKPPSWGS